MVLIQTGLKYCARNVNTENKELRGQCKENFTKLVMRRNKVQTTSNTRAPQVGGWSILLSIYQLF
jgi:hypothetical protein